MNDTPHIGRLDDEEVFFWGLAALAVGGSFLLVFVACRFLLLPVARRCLLFRRLQSRVAAVVCTADSTKHSGF
jgi:hypothetical protein